MQNICPAHVPDILIYLDTITIIHEEASRGGPPLSIPIACIEAGDDHSLPDLALRLFFYQFVICILFVCYTCVGGRRPFR